MAGCERESGGSLECPGSLASVVQELRKVVPRGHRAIGLVALASGADGGVEVGPLLGLVLGLEEVADGEETARGVSGLVGWSCSSACRTARRPSRPLPRLSSRICQAGRSRWG